MSSLNDFRSRVEAFRKSMKNSYENLFKKYEGFLEEFKKADLSISKDKLIDLYLDVKRLRIDFKRDLKNLYEDSRKAIRDFKIGLRELVSTLPKEYAEGADEIRRMLAEAAEDLEKYLRLSRDLERSFREFESRIRSLLVTKIPHPVPSVIVKMDNLTEALTEALDNALREAFSSTEKVLSKATEVVSSIRIPESDAKLIKLLVDAGIFRSRNEALAYFAHKGIEASRDWLNRIQERLHKIRELQEEARKELEEIFKEDTDRRKNE
jgi:Arc/MetJ-type ribon-helix-helix transcriptional regulator